MVPHNSEMEVKSNLNDLGVQLDSDLSFKVHIEQLLQQPRWLVWDLGLSKGGAGWS